MEMIQRARRLRETDAIRRMTRETRVSPDSLILPFFLKEGKDIKTPISSMDGHFHYSPDRVHEAVEEAMSMAWTSSFSSVYLRKKTRWELRHIMRKA